MVDTFDNDRPIHTFAGIDMRQVQTQMSNLQKSVNNLQGYAGLEIVASGELAQRPDLTIAFAVADAANEGKFRHFTNSSHNTS